MTRLHLIRHGETNWNAEGRIQGQLESVLSELGEQQATALQEKLVLINFDKVFSSTSTRARQTTALALSHWDKPVGYQDNLREIMLGRWEGQLYADVEIVEPQAVYAFRHTPDIFNVEGTETFHALQRRALAAVEEIMRDCAGMEIALVSHGAWIKSVLSHYEGRPISRFWEPPRMHNCCHSILEISPGATTPRIVRYADLDEGF
ncbi:MAG: histidine phosphatase family protein [Gammaproteobacteria bacterium]|nr:histidine phosphatase family protein [Gammaproteobacteria bacterium]MBQ0840914.1 histidine phosphatase family protein [Gammaproteobacteria bacterium]